MPPSTSHSNRIQTRLTSSLLLCLRLVSEAGLLVLMLSACAGCGECGRELWSPPYGTGMRDMEREEMIYVCGVYWVMGWASVRRQTRSEIKTRPYVGGMPNFISFIY